MENRLYADRKPTRRPKFDYASRRAYFVTLCVQDRACVFGRATGETVELSRRGIVARDCWLALPTHHPHVELDAFVVMPNHFHGLILLVDDVSDGGRSASSGPTRGSLGAVVGSYKSAVTRTINRLRPGAADGLWQRNYYDHVVRNDAGFDAVRTYIEANPRRWAQDRESGFSRQRDDFDALIFQLAGWSAESDSTERATQASPLRKDRNA